MTRTALTRALAPALTAATIVGSTLAGAPVAEAATPTTAFIARVAPAAVASQARTGVPASVSIAQAILETGWGTSNLSRTANNYFAIICSPKVSAQQSGCVLVNTQEVRRGRWVREQVRFRTYRTVEASFEDHARLLSTGYARAMPYRGDARRFVQYLYGYASDPAYRTKLLQLIDRFGLIRYDRPGARVPFSPAAPTTSGAVPAAARSWIVDRNAPASRVRVLQQALRAKGYTKVAVSGRWDSATLRAVRAVQSRAGLRTDGVVGPRTWRVL